jgi:hypothetical protein
MADKRIAGRDKAGPSPQEVHDSPLPTAAADAVTQLFAEWAADCALKHVKSMNTEAGQ